MSGIFGGSSAKTDRGNQLAATQGMWNVFNYGLPQGEAGQAKGKSDLGEAESYFNKLLTAGRSDTAASSAPAVNAELAHADAMRRQEGTSGTGRTGGTAEHNAESGASSSSNIDSIINKNLMGGRAEGAAGLKSIGDTELNNATNLLSLGSQADRSILDNATNSRKTSTQIHDDALAGFGQAAANLVNLFGF